MDTNENHFQTVEIEALKAIYCKDGEVTDVNSEKGWKINILLDLGHLRHLSHISQNEITFILPRDYPRMPPSINLQCDLISEDSVKEVISKLESCANNMVGEMVLLDLVCLAKELLEDQLNSEKVQREDFSECSREPVLKCGRSNESYATLTQYNSTSLTNGAKKFSFDKDCDFIPNDSSTQQIESDDKPLSKTVVLTLDHMRSKASYSKLIRKWAEELDLSGRLIFCQKVILILLQGSDKSIKDYIVRNRTTKVDVDSKGRSCKERMLSVLCEAPTRMDQRIKDFTVVELSSIDKMQQLFQDLSLEDVYTEHVEPQFSVPAGESTKRK